MFIWPDRGVNKEHLSGERCRLTKAQDDHGQGDTAREGGCLQEEKLPLKAKARLGLMPCIQRWKHSGWRHVSLNVFIISVNQSSEVYQGSKPAFRCE